MSKFNKIYNTFNRKIFDDCVSEISKKLRCQGVFTDIFLVDDDLRKLKVTAEYIVIFVADQFYFDHGLNSDNGMSVTESAIYNFVVSNPKIKKVILMHEHFPYNGLPLFTVLPNVESIYISDIVSGKESYTKLEPVSVKNLNTTKSTISLNRNMRPHRIAMVSYLYSLDLISNTYVSAIKRDKLLNHEALDFINWDFSKHQDFKNSINVGFKQATQSGLPTDDLVYDTVSGQQTVISYNNSKNFDKNLRNLYKNTFVEIVSETLYETKTGVVTEKYLNSVYGYNFPIIISTPHTVSHLRKLGFDMFDDIINHDYDNIQDPCERMEQSIKMNYEILSNSNIAIKKWLSVKSRFDDNLNFAKTKMYDIHYNLALNKTKDIIEKIVP